MGAEVYNFEWCDDFSAARNESIKYANHQWILLLDADEFVDENSIIELKKLLKIINRLLHLNSEFLATLEVKTPMNLE